MKFFIKLYISLFALLPISAELIHAQNKKTIAVRTKESPKIDGFLKDSCWNTCEQISDFMQYDPNYLAAPTQKTVVHIVYDDDAIYIGAMMFDSSPDSILQELGNRDDDLNADKFGVEFDTYNMQTEGYVFVVYASGVQMDYKTNDGTYNAVWQSAVKKLDNGWSCEIKINYSAIRFPSIDKQLWGLQIFRGIRRNRETDFWSMQTKGTGNVIKEWGVLEGIHNIKSPLRLSLTPFISLYGDYYPYNIDGKSNFSSSFSGGLDLKYGINESFTLDVTLLPDFSQVQSDYHVKNISAFETVYQDYRPFFTEAIDLFKQGDLFYTRRIGREPDGFYTIFDSLDTDENVVKNPQQAKLINAIKFSGRNKNGTAIGIFNAITNNMYASVKDSLENKRKILTEPLTNYNIFVFDQIFKNNSKIYFVNTNTIRTKKYDDSNVSLLGLIINDKKNNYQLSGNVALCQKLHRYDTVPTNFQNTLGYKYAISFGKISGKFQFNIYRNEKNNTWDANDLGLVLTNNQTSTGAAIFYNIYEPFGKIKDMSTSFQVDYTENYLTKYVENFTLSISNNFTTKKYLTVWSGINVQPIKINDFYEPRVPGRFYLTDEYYYINCGFSSDYRKSFALDFQGEFYRKFFKDATYLSIVLSPRIRISNHFLLTISSKYSKDINAIGFASFDNLNNILFGQRDVSVVENQLSARYIIKNNLSISLVLRHYWSDGMYNEMYNLNNDGEVVRNTSIIDFIPYNFNYNVLNIDLLFYWEFAPGSSLNIAYKNYISDENNIVNPSYFDNFGKVFGEKQLNSLSVKIVYYLDYQNIKRWSSLKKKIKI
ncbi:MAG: DUF5916 domain-containing protein [Bacteroidota bacterium]